MRTTRDSPGHRAGGYCFSVLPPKRTGLALSLPIMKPCASNHGHTRTAAGSGPEEGRNDVEPTKEQILAGYGRARHSLDVWLEGATAADLRRRSNGTRWTNEELLFHMVFGYMIVRALLPMVHTISRLPTPVGTDFPAVLKLHVALKIDAVPGQMGSVLRPDDDTQRRLRLPHASLRLPRTAAHPRPSALTGG